MNICADLPPSVSRDPPVKPSLQRAVLNDLRHKIAAIEGRPPQYDGARTAAPPPDREVTDAETGIAVAGASTWRFGLEAVDDALPNRRLTATGLHDIAAETYGDGPAALGFCLALLRRLQQRPGGSGTVLWCENSQMAREFGGLYGPGLAALGIDPDRLVVVTVDRDKEVLWAMEEGLRAAALAAVVGEVGTADFTASRRLSLACAEGATPALLLRHPRDATASAARTRWRVAARPGAADDWDARAPGRPRWFIELTRCRGGRPGTWNVEWNDATGDFRLAAGLADRTVAPQPATIRAWSGPSIRRRAG